MCPSPTAGDVPEAPGGIAPAADADTTAINRDRQHFANAESVWLFGYGSLIYKVDFPFLERRPALVRGWSRRFWQGSHDHRGTHACPGRVVTLVRDTGAACAGMAYRVAPGVFQQLDFREKNGYLRNVVRMEFKDGSSTEGLVYVAAPANAAWLGPASDLVIARRIADSAGPSGSNRDYAMNLAQALRDLGANDEHVFAIEAALRKLLPVDGGAR